MQLNLTAAHKTFKQKCPIKQIFYLEKLSSYKFHDNKSIDAAE